MMTNRKELTEEKNWVVIDRETGMPHHVLTFKEALECPIKGTIMTKTYYETSYKFSIK